jgi:hypothetical protein
MYSDRGFASRAISHIGRALRFGVVFGDMPQEIIDMIIKYALDGAGDKMSAVLASVNKDTSGRVTRAMVERSVAKLDTPTWLRYTMETEGHEAPIIQAAREAARRERGDWWHKCSSRFHALVRIYVTGDINADVAGTCIHAFVAHLASHAPCECDDLKLPEIVAAIRAIIDTKKTAAQIEWEQLPDLVNTHETASVRARYGNAALWDTSGLESMRLAFFGHKASAAPINVRLWDTSGVTDMTKAFLQTSGSVRGLECWSTGKVACMEKMFCIIHDQRKHRRMGHIARNKHDRHVPRRINLQPGHWQVGHVARNKHVNDVPRRIKLQPGHWRMGHIARKGHGTDVQRGDFVQPSHWRVEHISRKRHDQHVWVGWRVQRGHQRLEPRAGYENGEHVRSSIGDGGEKQAAHRTDHSRLPVTLGHRADASVRAIGKRKPRYAWPTAARDVPLSGRGRPNRKRYIRIRDPHHSQHLRAQIDDRCR